MGAANESDARQIFYVNFLRLSLNVFANVSYHAEYSMTRGCENDRPVLCFGLNQPAEYRSPLALNYPEDYSEWFGPPSVLRPSTARNRNVFQFDHRAQWDDEKNLVSRMVYLWYTLNCTCAQHKFCSLRCNYWPTSDKWLYRIAIVFLYIFFFNNFQVSIFPNGRWPLYCFSEYYALYGKIPFLYRMDFCRFWRNDTKHMVLNCHMAQLICVNCVSFAVWLKTMTEAVIQSAFSECIEIKRQRITAFCLCGCVELECDVTINSPLSINFFFNFPMFGIQVLCEYDDKNVVVQTKNRREWEFSLCSPNQT